MITEKQKQLIQYMNEFCREKFDLENNHSKKDAQEYISRNIEEYKLLIIDNWCLQNGYFWKWENRYWK